MNANFRYMLRRYRLAIAGWGLALAIVAVIAVRLYSTILERMEVVEKLMAGMPPLLVALAGEASVLATPGGWLHVKFFVMVPILLGIYCVQAGAGLLAGDEERGRLDLLMAYPVSRTRLFLGRLLALVTATGWILAICWAAVFLALPGSGMKIHFGESLLPFLNTLAPLLLFEMLALALSMIMPSKLLAAGAAGFVLVASFFIELLLSVEPALLSVAKLLPLHYYRGGLALESFGWPGFLGQLGVALLLGVFAYWRFLRRDIRVMGEGSWRW
jgi:ABC-2 type transport system permease protein